jgi:hypothetical protein
MARRITISLDSATRPALSLDDGDFFEADQQVFTLYPASGTRISGARCASRWARR